MSCSVKGCERAVSARGWCSAHYNRWYKGYDLNTPIGKGGGTYGYVKPGSSPTKSPSIRELEWAAGTNDDIVHTTQ